MLLITGLTFCAAINCGIHESERTVAMETFHPLLVGPREIDVSDIKAADLPAIKAAARSGDANALLKLAIAYGYGIGVKVDADRYLSYIGSAARRGNAEAEDTVGKLLLESSAVESIHLFMLSAAQRFAEGEQDLGLSYLLGRGVKQDKMKACALFSQAANQGNADGEYSIGACYFNGIGVTAKSDYGSALTWYTRSANQDFPLAEQGLAVIYGYGLAGSDKIQALKWALLAMQDPNHEVNATAVGQLAHSLTSEMSPAEIQESKRAAAAFRATHVRYPHIVLIDPQKAMHSLNAEMGTP